VNRQLINVRAARSWRDIPQPVKPRTMSRGGRWRLYASGLRIAFAAVIAGGIAWGVWRVAGAVQGDPGAIPASARSTPVRAPELVTDGAHTPAWLVRTLALPADATLMELDLEQLHRRLLDDGQVLGARLTRHFPDRLVVHVMERVPVARVMAEWVGRRFPLLVARDGTIFPGEGYAEKMLNALPWLDGVALVRHGDGFAPIAGMHAVADLLAKAQVEAPHLYRTWNVVSLARYELDRELEVRTFNRTTIVFNAAHLFLPQLGRLDYIWRRLEGGTAGPVRVDLSHGWEVPVRLELPAGTTRSGPGPANRAPPASSLFPTPPPQTKREL
jgi:hypothetical protein